MNRIVQNFKENKIDQLSFIQKLISKKLQLKNEQNNFFLNLCPGVYIPNYILNWYYFVNLVWLLRK